jgi:uncharacterized protein YfiM (DUF2279 family)
VRLLAIALALGLGATAARAQSSDPWGSDKALHFSMSAVLAGGSYAGAALLLEYPWQRARVAVSLTLGLGAAKELYDAMGRGDPSLRDFTWDVLGCALGVAVAWLIDCSRAERRQSRTMWTDSNHDGVSDPSELASLKARGVLAIRITARPSRAVDEHGNRFAPVSVAYLMDRFGVRPILTSDVFFAQLAE